MIALLHYFAKPHTSEQGVSAADLLVRVNNLCEAVAWPYPTDPDTGTSISGARGGDGDGGFRTPGTRTGSARSSHREGRGVDVYDPENVLDTIITDALLTAHGLYREHPSATPGWCHLTTRAPGSGHRTFYP